MGVGLAVAGAAADIGRGHSDALAHQVLDEGVEVRQLLALRAAVDLHYHREVPCLLAPGYVEPEGDLQPVEGPAAHQARLAELPGVQVGDRQGAQRVGVQVH